MKDGVGKRKDSLFPAFFFLALNTAFSPALLQDRAVALAISAASACERRREKSFPCPSFSIAKGGRRQLGPDEKRYGLPPSLRRREGKNWDFHPLKRKEAILESGPFFSCGGTTASGPSCMCPNCFLPLSLDLPALFTQQTEQEKNRQGEVFATCLVWVFLLSCYTYVYSFAQVVSPPRSFEAPFLYVVPKSLFR